MTTTQTENTSSKARTFVLLLCLLGSVTVLATPFLAELRTKSGLGRAAQMISSTVHLTRQKAMAGETSYRIAYDYRDQFFRIYRREEGRWVLDSQKDHFLLPQGVVLSPASRPASGDIIIDENGVVSSEKMEVLLKLFDGNGNQLSIKVSKAGQLQEIPGW